ncbi:MAG: ABC transporter substrate-binding protein [Planctomycetes bacterium]|nr:ABC transporter substrate-binding protein [Planctomycetota bacterium]
MEIAGPARWIPVAAGLVLCGIGPSGCRGDRTVSREPPVLRIGHVGHDHQLALYVAALEGRRFLDGCGVFLRQVREGDVYDLVGGERVLARLLLIKVGGGSGMPAAMGRGEIDIGLGSVVAVAKLCDEGQHFRIIAPLQTDGDMLVVHRDSPIADWPSFVSAAKAAERPLRIGYKAPIATAKMIFELALAAEGIAFGPEVSPAVKVAMVNFGSETSPLPLLESRAIDGFVMNQPGPAIAVHKGLGRVVADLRDLPPEGKWADHPCCCVAALESTLRTRAEIIEAFLRLIIHATDRINEDRELAIDSAVRWIRNERDIEEVSVPTVRYVARPTDTWLAGMETWAEMMQDVGLFAGRFSSRTPAEIVRELCSLDLCRRAADALPAARPPEGRGS